MIATVQSASLLGAEGEPVAVEVHVSTGLPGFTIVGLPDVACREARDRVRAALLSSGMSWPQQRVTVNLAPSSLPKVGTGLDLPIAVGVLAATGELPAPCIDGCGFLGELGLDGSLRPILGVVALVAATRASSVVVPVASAAEAQLVSDRWTLAAVSLRQAVDALRGVGRWAPAGPPASPPKAPAGAGVLDLADVRGQPLGRTAIEVAAAGGHHLLLVGPPGAGKTMLAHCLPGLLPPLTTEESLETRRVHSAAGALAAPWAGDRPPFRAPHHSASPVALIGGGSATMRPGEISLASNGVLFLDELGEFAPSVLETLRQPIEQGIVRVARARGSVTFPAQVLLVAATNPCPCGEGSLPGGCRCSPAERARYHRRLSGPLLDRFDLQVVVERPDPTVLLAPPCTLPEGPPESSELVAARVAAVRGCARRRGARCNAAIPASRLDEVAPLDREAREVLREDLAAGSTSARGLVRLRLVALTLADLRGHEGPLRATHVRGALSLRVGRTPLMGER